MASWSTVTTAPNRRTVLGGGLLAVGGIAALPVLSACDRGPTTEQVLAARLGPVAVAALDDAAAARRLVPGNTDYAAALGVVAAERDVHAKALREEITRLDPPVAQSLATSVPPASAITLDTFRTQLDRSARQAADVGVTMDGYRAGLLASVSASTITLGKVQLA